MCVEKKKHQALITCLPPPLLVFTRALGISVVWVWFWGLCDRGVCVPLNVRLCAIMCAPPSICACVCLCVRMCVPLCVSLSVCVFYVWCSFFYALVLLTPIPKVKRAGKGLCSQKSIRAPVEGLLLSRFLTSPGLSLGHLSISKPNLKTSHDHFASNLIPLHIPVIPPPMPLLVHSRPGESSLHARRKSKHEHLKYLT